MSTISFPDWINSLSPQSTDGKEIYQQDGSTPSRGDLDDKASLSVSKTKKDTFSESVASRDTVSSDIPGMVLNITPKSESQGVDINALLYVGLSASDNNVYVNLYRNGDIIGSPDEAGDRTLAHGLTLITDINAPHIIAVSFTDYPSTIDEVTYSLRLSHSRTVSETVYVNRGDDDSNASFRFRTVSTIKAYLV